MIDQNLIYRYFAKETTTEEGSELLDWLEEDEENLKLYQKYFELWIAKQAESDQNIFRKNKVWDNISSITDTEKQKAHKPNKSVIVWLRRIAASFILAVGLAFTALYLSDTRLTFNDMEYQQISYDPSIGYIIFPDGSHISLPKEELSIKYKDSKITILTTKNQVWYSSNENKSKQIGRLVQELYVPFGTSYNVEFEDGTKVKLNSGSKFLFSNNSFSKERQVALNGEAYFEVAKNEERPFIVNTDIINVEVLGTKFNVRAYKNENLISTTLISGSVAITSNNEAYKFEDVILKPNDRAQFFIKERHLKIQNGTDTELSSSWTNKMLKFNNESLQKVLEKLSIYYGLELDVTNADLHDITYSGKLNLRDSVQDILIGIQLSTCIDYKIDGRNLSVSSKQSEKVNN
ncbi:FecR family protein [Marinifilum sp.]|uniref:FecR family protein n=1 Tax=Marinifilum sp. TaxID=2033137 RepID=UPI003BAB0386